MTRIAQLALAWLVCALVAIRLEQHISGYCPIWEGVRAFMAGPAVLLVYVVLIGCDATEYLGREL